MANKNGIITRKDIIEDEALKFGEVYAANVKKAIDSNKTLIDSVKELNKQVTAFKVSNSQKDYITAKQAEALATQETIDAIKIQEAAEISMNKIRLSSIAVINAEKKAMSDNSLVWKEQKQLEDGLISTKRKNELATEGTNKALVKERLLLAETNKEIKQQAREELGLVSAYEKLNRARLEAQKRLGELLSAEKQNTAEIARASLEFEKLDARVKAVDAALKIYSKNIGNYQSAFDGLAGSLRELMATFGIVTGLALFGTIMKDVYNVVAEFDRQLIAVGKTANINDEALKEFGRAVVELGGELDGISIQGLLKSSEIAGTLGVQGTENILKFSRAIEELKLTSDIVTDEQVGQFAKFIEVSQDSFENADRLASVITKLGNDFATTEKEVLSNSTEIQKGIAIYNASAQSVLGLGAATATLGNEAEVSASSIQKTFGVIDNAIATGKNLDKVLKVTGLTQKQLSEQFSKDASGTFEKFVGGLARMKNEGQNLRVILQGLELDEVRTFKVIGSLAANYDILKNSMIAANAEYELNAALSQEVDKASKSLESIVSDIKDKWQEYILTAADANDGTQALAKVLSFLRDNLQAIITAVIKYGSVLLVFIGVQKTVNFLTATFTALKIASTTAQIQFALATGIGTKSILAQAAAVRSAAAAQEGLNVAMTATPWGIILAALAAVITAYIVFNDELSESERRINAIRGAQKDLQESEDYYSKERDKHRSSEFKAIEEDIRLRKAKGENSEKLDKEEITRKKAVVQAQLDVFNDLKKMEIDRTKSEIDASNQRVAQMERELKWFEENNYRRNKQGNTKEGLNESIGAEGEKAELLKAKLKKNSEITVAEQKRLKQILDDLEKDANVKTAEAQLEEDKKAKAARLKRLKEIYEAEKKAADDLFKLRQFRLQVAIDMDKEIMESEKSTFDEKIAAFYESQQLYEAKIKEAAEREFQLLGKYNEEKGVFVRQFTDLQIAEILRTNTIAANASAEQKLIFEKLQNDLTNLAKKGAKDRKKLIEDQVSAMKKAADEEILVRETAVNKEIEDQNKLLKKALEVLEANKKINESSYLEGRTAGNSKMMADALKAQEDNNKLIESAIEAHEKKVFEIRKKYAIDALNVQVSSLQSLLDENAKKPVEEQLSADKIKVINADLQKYKTEISDLELQKYKGNAEERGEIERVTAEQILSISQNLANAISDLVNAVFDAKIAKIDEEIQATDEYYQGEIEKAGNDAKKKELLQQEAEKKRQVLEEKKRKEQHKQAVFNKAAALAQAGINTALAILAALNTQPFLPLGPAMAILAGIMGGIQIAAIAAAPIPKYKHGRKDGPEELAYVGDGGVSEVIQRKRGGIEITPASATLVKLNQGDKVHSSVEEYMRLQRASIMASINTDGRKFKDAEANVMFGIYNDKLLSEMKNNTEAIKKQKQTIIVQSPKIDIPHSIWKHGNTNWS